MFSKLVFVVDSEEIEFQLHELVRILQYVASNQRANVSFPSIPKYPAYEENIIQNFNRFSKGIIDKYAKYYEVNKEILAFILRNFNGRTLSAFKETAFFQVYLVMMNRIKSKDKPSTPYIDNEQFNQLILPPFIPPINNATGWLGLACYAREIEERSDWWINIGGRIILLRSLPTERQHFYVSDHGSCADVLIEVKQNLIEPNLNEGRKRMLHCFKFWRHYRGNLSDQEREYIKKHFIIMLHRGLGGNNLRNEFLLFVLSLPESCRDRALQNGRLNYQFFNMSYSIGTRDTATSPWIRAPSEEVLSQITSEEYAEYNDIFNQTRERIRYLGDIQATTFVIELFHGGFSQFFTQIDQIFNRIDAEQYKIFFVLNQLALELGSELQKFLLRPIKSFGSAEEGESYRGFSRAFERYYSSGLSVKNPCELAMIMRSLLQGSELDDASLYFLPNLVSAWFVSETARNEVSILSGLMLLDLMESGVRLFDEEGNDLYSWRHTLIHPKKPDHTMDTVLIQDMYGDEIDLANFDGIHPMAHAGSVQDTKTKLGEKKLSAVRQKEGHLAIHWLSERLKLIHSELEYYLVVAKPESESTEEQPCSLLNKDDTSYKLIDKLLAADEKPSSSVKKNKHQFKKWKLLHEIIILTFRIRLETLDCLLSPCVIPLPEIIQLDITASLLASLQTGIQPALDHLISDTEQRQVRALRREQDYRHALQNRPLQDTYPPLGNDWVHHKTMADGNCALSAIALGLLYYRNNGNDLLTTHNGFRRQFALPFGINPDTFTPDAFFQVLNTLLSPAINFDNPIIKQIIAKLRSIEHIAPGTEKDQINMKIIAANNQAIKPEAFEHGDIRLEYSEEAIRILARQAILYQLAMAYVLRIYCASHNEEQFICNTDQLDESQDIEITLHVTNQYGEYLDDSVIAFLANIFGLTIRTKANEFGRITRYGTGDTEILIFNLRSGAADCHFELVLHSTAEFLENRLMMPNAMVNLLVPSVSQMFSSFSFFRRFHEWFITEHRHENPQLQRAHDERFGLMLRR
ncbi:hypothetical protein CbuD7D7780_04105 [Coxiella burnetii]|uniref:OTU domain-containing protein n=1 Tax=Coxiella burnetii (strain Dugway 5J108-111) TaxID=434922 RepID=A9KDW5_COXBN|nr:hypothetical protein [Coxiella burnetii]ABS77731.1 hypothetical protein CBUD_0797 [Coxiella burnetii Dugway 5J108-111]OYK80460.1 hypothetical protein CbuD7E6568_04085 [Coxiella burnetii]OYK82418.1 hypothetical protein CbuD7D7780_04105 [Coxiella burnetii]